MTDTERLDWIEKQHPYLKIYVLQGEVFVKTLTNTYIGNEIRKTLDRAIAEEKNK